MEGVGWREVALQPEASQEVCFQRGTPLPQPEGPLDLRPVSRAAGEGHRSRREWEGLLWVGPCPPREEELPS